MTTVDLFKTLKNNFFIICGPNVIESREHVFKMCRAIKSILEPLNIPFIFKVSFDKANRTSLSSYRGIALEEACEIFRDLRQELGVYIITDIHEAYQIDLIKDYVDIIQIPAFLCRQTDLLIAAGNSQKIIHIKKGQFCGAETMHHCVKKILSTGNNRILLCERGNMFGYNDLVVDPRNLVKLRSPDNLVTMDITHCLQKPGGLNVNGNVCSGGERFLIPYMGRTAVTLGVNGIFMEVHDNPEESLCDAPTQFPLNKLGDFVRELINIRKVVNNNSNVEIF